MSDHSGNILTNNLELPSGRTIYSRSRGNILTNNLELPSGRTIYSRSRGLKINLSNSVSDENIIRFFYRTAGGVFLTTINYTEIPEDAVLLKTVYE